MTPERKQRAIDACLTAAMLILVVLGVRAHAAQPDVFLPIVRGQAIRVTGPVFPPSGTSCLLQTGASMVVDPRTDEQVFSCESKNGHGAIVFSAHKLLLDHAAVGSGSLSVIDGAVYLTAVNENGSLQIVEVPTK